MTAAIESDDLHARVRTFIAASLAGEPTEGFDALALAIARFQSRHVEPFARLARSRDVDLERADTADVIPAVPADVFRLARIAAHPPEQDAVVFRTSGTMKGEGMRGEHAFRTTATYEAAALGWGARMLWPDGPNLSAFALAPDVAEAPDSSLSFMIDLFAKALVGPRSAHVHGTSLDVAALTEACAAARAARLPVLVMGTSFAFVHLLDAWPGDACALPKDSRVMQTGGFKGRSREVEPIELRRAISRLFGIDAAHVVGEYGMTELSSQLYETTLLGGLHGTYRPPPWLSVRAADPTMLAVLPRGEMGIARFVDLANVDSAVAVQTADLVRVAPNGDVELFGRAKGAAPRGCSIAIDAILSGA